MWCGVLPLSSPGLALAQSGTPEELVARLNAEFLDATHRPESPDFDRVVETIIHPDGIVRIVIEGQAAMTVTRNRLKEVARLLASNRFRNQGVWTERTVRDLDCVETADLATCMVFVDLALLDGSGETQTFEDVVVLQKVDGRWMILAARWMIVPSADATTIYTLATDPTSIANVRSGGTESSREWNRRFPLLGKKVYAMGVDLPLPYGVAVIPNWNKQLIDIRDLRVSFNEGAEIGTEFVRFSPLETEVFSTQVKLDFWFLPFLNVFGTVGYVAGDVRAPISFDVRDLADIVDPGICSGLLTPDFCEQTINAVIRTDVGNFNTAFGIVPAFGLEYFFFTSPVTYSFTFLNAERGSPARTFVWSPRVGLTATTKAQGRLSGYVGFTYMRSQNVVGDRLSYSVPEETPIIGGEVLTLDYTISQSGLRPWNFVTGFNWDITHDKAMSFEIGSAGSRNQVIASFTKRW